MVLNVVLYSSAHNGTAGEGEMGHLKKENVRPPQN